MNNRRVLYAVAAVGMLLCVQVEAGTSLDTEGPSIVTAQKTTSPEMEEYLARRSEAQAVMDGAWFSRDTPMDRQERALDKLFVEMRDKQTSKFQEAGRFPPAEYFLDDDVKSQVEQSEVFRFIRDMPKGGALHVHVLTGIASPRYQVRYFTSRPGFYVLWKPELKEEQLCHGTKVFHGSVAQFAEGQVCAGFEPVETVRARIKGFDKQLIALLRMHGGAGLDSSQMWDEFHRVMGRTRLAWSRDYFIYIYRETMLGLAKDGVMLMELRTPLDPIDKDCATPECAVDTFSAILDQVRKSYPGFMLKLIVCTGRYSPQPGQPDKRVLAARTSVDMMLYRPDLVVGFDMVGAEDSWDGVGAPALDYAPAVLEGGMRYARERGLPSWPLFLHDGESVWPKNDNILDAVLLNSTRIGHGLNLFRYPSLISTIRDRRTAIEVCPISNQVLGYVRDLRMHPAAGYLAAGIQIVLSHDDAGIYGYDGLSFDFWAAAMAWDLDLRDLKRIAMNSIVHSSLTSKEKDVMMASWTAEWNEFVRKSTLAYS